MPDAPSPPPARILGVLGGMGPLASAEFMRVLTLLTPAARDQDHIPCILWSDPRIPDRTAARLGQGEDPLPALLRGVRGLEAAGAGAIAIPCNSAHGWHDRLQAATPLTVLHIVDAAAAEVARLALPEGPVGLLATEATHAARLYEHRLGRDCLVLAPAERAALVTPAIAEVKANRVAAAHAPLAEAAGRLRARGAVAVVLGCTEIPLGVAAGPPLPFPVVDSIAALARAAIAWARAGEGEPGGAARPADQPAQ